ncbi:MAG: M48 family metallopeptidase [Victivallaceae bacterium]|nr:M48 family metallopeptidase [Victivallaceae bacterium]
MKEVYRTVVSERRRRIAFSIAPDGILEVRTPPGVSPKMIERLVERYRAVIDELKARADRNRPAAPGEDAVYRYRGRAYPVRTTRRLAVFDDAFLLPEGPPEARFAALEKIYRAATAAYVLPRAAYLAEKHGVAVQKFSISGAAHRYGSCSVAGCCSFSWRLIQFPDEMIDYVICHELAHRFHMDHSPRFYAALEKLYPGAGNVRREMNSFARRCKLF